MEFITIFTMFSPKTKETDALIIPNKSFFIASTLIVFLQDDSALSDNIFPNLASDAE